MFSGMGNGEPGQAPDTIIEMPAGEKGEKEHLVSHFIYIKYNFYLGIAYTCLADKSFYSQSDRLISSTHKVTSVLIRLCTESVEEPCAFLLPHLLEKNHS